MRIARETYLFYNTVLAKSKFAQAETQTLLRVKLHPDFFELEEHIAERLCKRYGFDIKELFPRGFIERDRLPKMNNYFTLKNRHPDGVDASLWPSAMPIPTRSELRNSGRVRDYSHHYCLLHKLNVDRIDQLLVGWDLQKMTTRSPYIAADFIQNLGTWLAIQYQRPCLFSEIYPKTHYKSLRLKSLIGTSHFSYKGKTWEGRSSGDCLDIESAVNMQMLFNDGFRGEVESYAYLINTPFHKLQEALALFWHG